MQFSDFETAADYVRQYNEIKSILDFMNTNVKNEMTVYIQCSADQQGYAGTNLSTTKTSTFFSTVKTLLEDRSQDLVAKLGSLDVEMSQPSTGGETPSEEPSSSE